jgi:aminoglycoside phosphotransferase (APT) family kinase protein
MTEHQRQTPAQTGAPAAAVDDLAAEYGEVREEERLDWPRLQAYLREHAVPGADTAMEVLQFRGGSSNLTYLLRFADGHQWVVRRPPFGPLPPSAHDMAREYRVLSRLWEGFAAAPRAIVLCEDPSIIGATFFVMERREGAVIKNRHPLPPEIDAKPETFRRISENLVDTLADLHAADYEKIGLGGLGRPEGFLQRQITGWTGRWEKAKTREVPLMEKLGTWFLEHMPAAQKPVLLHNDFYLHNLMFQKGDSGKVVGVFDWEMSTLGDPMIDLGLTIGYWREAGDPPELIALSQGFAHTTAPGFLGRDQMIQRYAARSGRDVSMVDYYRAWANWKTATVVEQIYVRYVRGQTSDPRFANMGEWAPVLARQAARVVAKFGFRE